MAYRLWKDGSARNHIYNTCIQSGVKMPDMCHFQRFYCYLYYEFDKLWLSQKPATIMEFGRVRDCFEDVIRGLLADKDVILKLNFLVDQI